MLTQIYNLCALQDLDILEDDVPKIKEFRKEEVEKSKQGEKVCTRSRTTRLRMKKSPRYCILTTINYYKGIVEWHRKTAFKKRH